ncbi:MAG: hypothetical protein ACHQUC_05855, partial [Chlamydiales bacterium]
GDNRDPGIQEHTKNMLKKIIDSQSRHFLMFDDASYTGTQISNYLQDFRRQLDDHFFSKKSKFAETVNIYFIFGFAPRNMNFVSNYTWSRFQEYNVKIQFITSGSIDNIGDLMKKENLSDQMREKIKKITMIHKMLFITDWKTPDLISTPNLVTEGDFWNLGTSSIKKLLANLRPEFSSTSLELTKGLLPDFSSPELDNYCVDRQQWFKEDPPMAKVISPYSRL